MYSVAVIVKTENNSEHEKQTNKIENSVFSKHLDSLLF